MNQSLSTKIHKTTYSIVRLIQESQFPDGSFFDCPSVFANSLILRCLESLKHFRDVEQIRRYNTFFLLDKKSANWSWNYWPSKSTCPNDLDDTFSVLSAIDLHNCNLITGEALAHISNTLILCETETGGPYNTWVLNPKQQIEKWCDIDIVVNSNVAYFLKLKGVKMPHLIEYTEKTIMEASLNGKYESKYYDDLIVLYFISRWYTGRMTKNIQRQVLRLRNNDGCWGNKLRDAMAISILTSVEAAPELFVDTVTNLAESIEPFTALPLYTESVTAGKPKHASSAVLTAAFCGEALSLFEQKYLKQKSDAGESEERLFKEKIVFKVKDTFKHFCPKIKSLVNDVLDKIQNNNQALLVSYHFAKSSPLSENLSSNLCLNICIELETANLFGWLAYTIYDDILDMEKNRTNLLPIANICFMKALQIYSTVNNSNINVLSGELILKMEKINAWEKEFCSFDDIKNITPEKVPVYVNYDNLAYKSMPHSLGPVSLFLTTGKDPSDLIEFFKHYLIARQLNDDAHDWLDDLKRGFVNSVGSLILSEYFSDSSKSSISNKDISGLSILFQHKIIDTVSTSILLEVSRAQSYLEKIPPNWNIDNLKEMIIPLEQAAERAINERNSILEFLSVYEKV